MSFGEGHFDFECPIDIQMEKSGKSVACKNLKT